MDRYTKEKQHGQILFISIFLGIVGCFSLLCLWRSGAVLKNLYQSSDWSQLQEVNVQAEESLKSEFPGVRLFADLKGIVLRVAGKDVGGNFEYIKDGNQVVRIVSDGDRPVQVGDSIIALKKVLDKKNIPLVYTALPDAGAYIQGDFHVEGQLDPQFLESLKEHHIDVVDLNEEKKNSPLSETELNFYTDFHYTTAAEFWIADVLSRYLSSNYQVDFENRDQVFSLESYDTTSYPFVGNAVRNLGKYYTQRDYFEVYYPKFDTSLELFVPQTDIFRTGNFDQVLLNGYDQGGVYDEYTYWVTDFGQFPNESYIIKNNRAQNAADVLVICDSIFMRGFSYLSLCSGSVTVFDPRVDQSSALLSLLLEVQDYDAVIVVGLSDDFFASSFHSDPIPAKQIVDGTEETTQTDVWVDACSNGQVDNENLQLLLTGQSDLLTFSGGTTGYVNGHPVSKMFVAVGNYVAACNYGFEYESSRLLSSGPSQTGFTCSIPRDWLEAGDAIRLILVSDTGERVDYEYDVAQANTEYFKEIVSQLQVSQAGPGENSLWIDYCNDVAQPDAQLVHLDLSQSDELSFSGWAADLTGGTPLGALYVQIGDQIFQCHYGEERGAVADYFQNENLKYTGFSFSVPADVFQGGAVDAMIFIEVSQDGSYRYEDVPYQIDYAQNSGAEGTGDPQTIPQQPGDSAQSGGNENLFASKYVTILLLAVVILTFCLLLFLLVHNDQGEMLRKFNQKKFLFSELIKRDFTLKYKRTILGMFWSILFPLVNLLIMWLVFNKLLGSNIDHFVVYLFAGQLIFNYFSDATNMGMTSLVDNASIFTKVNVPKYLFLFSRNVSTLINFGLTLIIFFLFVGLDGIPFSVKFLSLLYPIICLIILNLGTGMILSALYMFFRDMRYLWSVATQLLMWMSAIFYSIDGFSEEMQRLFLLNPVYLCIRYFRKVVIEDAIPTAQFHLLLAAISLGIFAVGCIVYKKKNHEFLYYV